SHEIAWSRDVLEAGSIAGDVKAPYLTEGHEGVDVNAQSDWWHAEYLVAQGMATLPPISTEPYPG
ncbi:MAG: hypothetical protein VW709_17420, partial [Rickettsiales bacterium]